MFVEKGLLLSNFKRQFNEIFDITGKVFTKIENILSQVGSIEEKNWRPKISLECPFK